jgi:hypothetical protein
LEAELRRQVGKQQQGKPQQNHHRNLAVATANPGGQRQQCCEQKKCDPVFKGPCMAT